MTTNVVTRTQFSWTVDTNTQGLILQRVQPLGPTLAFSAVTVKDDSKYQGLIVQSGANSRCLLTRYVAGEPTIDNSADGVRAAEIRSTLNSIGIYFQEKRVLHIVTLPTPLIGQSGAPSSIYDTMSCPPDNGFPITVIGLYPVLTAANQMIADVSDLERAEAIFNNGRANPCTRDPNRIINCDPFEYRPIPQACICGPRCGQSKVTSQTFDLCNNSVTICTKKRTDGKCNC